MIGGGFRCLAGVFLADVQQGWMIHGEPLTKDGSWCGRSVTKQLTDLLSRNEACAAYRLQVDLLAFGCSIAASLIASMGFQDNDALSQRGSLYVSSERALFFEDTDHVLMGTDRAWDILRNIRGFLTDGTESQG
mmetsp:Transcript_83840/g.245821  ORF Transcript_83840/g.245821 Transcript_83840/m.245821 type:complete len:134 (-) Transcript_83840:30-431(-)